MQKTSGNVFPGIQESDFFIFSQGQEMGGDDTIFQMIKKIEKG